MLEAEEEDEEEEKEKAKKKEEDEKKGENKEEEGRGGGQIFNHLRRLPLSIRSPTVTSSKFKNFRTYPRNSDSSISNLWVCCDFTM